MESIPKFFASVVTIIVGVLLCVSMIVAAVVVNSAREYHSSVIDQIEASNFKEATIEKCLDAAGKNGYQLSIDESTTADSGPYSFYTVTLKYNLTAPIFGRIHTGTIVGYALSGARMDIIVPGVEPGLYETGSGYSKLLRSWEDLTDSGIVVVSGTTVSGGGEFVDALTGDLLFPGDGSVTQIADGAFSSCINLSGIKVSDGIVSIGQNAFAGCTGLTEVELGKDVVTIWNFAFASCDNISSVNYIGNIDSWCNISFADTQANPVYSEGTGADLYFDGQLVESVVIPANVTSVQNKFAGCISIKSLLVPDGSYITTIPDNSFFGCKGLLTVNIGSGVKHLGDNAFAECTLLRGITISDTVEHIGETAFSGCDNLQNIYVSEDNVYYQDVDGKTLVEIATNDVIAGEVIE